MKELRITVVDAIDEVSAAAWDACANPAHDSASNCSTLARSASAVSEPDGQGSFKAHEIHHKASYNPFISHDFLSSLEQSHSVGARAGWQPQHMLARMPDGALVAAAPCYLKSHSRGEYVFDRGWAEAYERAGGSYYPKLQVAVPFTPATRGLYALKVRAVNRIGETQPMNATWNPAGYMRNVVETISVSAV